MSTARASGALTRAAQHAAQLLLIAALLGTTSCAPLGGPPGGQPSDTAAHAADRSASGNLSVFPLERYDQRVDSWIDPHQPGYDTPVWTAQYQREQFAAFSARYFGTAPDDAAPWNPVFVDSMLSATGLRSLAATERRALSRHDNAGQRRSRIGYGENFRAHDAAWINAIAANLDADQFLAERPGQAPPHFMPERRAIATDNILVRVLPTDDPHYYSFHQAGEGYPFDNLQVTAIRPGTPLYVAGQSVDRAWLFVITPDVVGWVHNSAVAYTDDNFVTTWRAAAAQGLAAVITAAPAIVDTDGVFRFDAPLGTVLPMAAPISAAASAAADASGATHAAAGVGAVLVPAQDAGHRAVIRRATPAAGTLVPMPLAATPRHLAMVMKALIGRPYGWGNTLLYNDCSAETRSLFTPFGVWLPRHSSNQMGSGTLVDMSPATPQQRLDYLIEHGKPLTTLIYIGGHVMLYIGTTQINGQPVAMTYQNIWGLRPHDNSRRAVIGGSVIFPLLLSYPEDPTLESLAAKRYFQVSVLGAPAQQEHFALPATTDDAPG